MKKTLISRRSPASGKPVNPTRAARPKTGTRASGRGRKPALDQEEMMMQAILCTFGPEWEW